MGACSSCLGHDRDRDIPDEDEQARLLFDDPHANHYGSFNDHNAGIIQADPLELQRESEALQKVVAQTSNHLVDIFALVPQAAPASTATTLFPPQDARLSRYQDVLAKMSGSDAASRTIRFIPEGTPNASDGWESEEDDVEEMRTCRPIKSDGIGPLLGTFAESESAMR